ncbi:MAG: SBBP repeat-containing protein [Bryobacteraceae bacterium]|jgi:hypothetical protein
MFLHSIIGAFAAMAAAATLSAAGPSASAPTPSQTLAKAALAGLPLHFEENRGQWKPGVRYAARANGYTVALTGRGATLAVGGGRHIEMTLRHANPNPRIEPEGRLDLRTDYYLGARPNWHAGIASFARVRYRQVYPGVDLIYYGTEGQLEYDFVLAPGADPRAVRMKFDGVTKLSLNPEGDLVINGSEGTVVEKRPVIYQQDPARSARTEVKGGYVLLGRDTVGLRLERYDPKRALVVDPVLAYSTYMGGSLTDYITSVQTDNKGNLYVAGTTGTSDLVATSNAYNSADTADLDIFLAVIGVSPSAAYGVTYLTYIGGAQDDVPLSMAVDSSQNMYVAGTTKSTTFPLTSNAFDTAIAPNTFTGGFVLVLNPSISGTSGLVFSSFLGGTTGGESPNAVAYDSSGNFYVAGTTQSTDWPVTSNAYASAINGPEDAYIAQINPTSGTLTYGSYMGGELLDDGRGIAVGSNGLVYFACSSNSTMFPAAGNPHQSNLAGGFDVVVGVMDLTQVGPASLLYTSYLGGSGSDLARGLTLDSQGNMVVTGYTLSSNFPVTADAAQPTYAGYGDVFVSVLNYTNPKFVLYSTYLGGSDGEVAYGVTADSSGYIYVTGYTLSQDFPITANAIQGAWGNGIEVFVTKIQPHVAGKAGFIWSTYLGSATANYGYGIAVGSDGRVYVGGSTGGNFPSGNASYQPYYGGGNSDGFVAVISQ